MAIFITVADTPAAASPPPTTWTFAQLGDARGELTEDSATQLDMTVQGTNDHDNKDVAYQTVSTSEDIQIVARIPLKSGWTGHKENYTGFGVGITEDISAGAWLAQCWSPNIGSEIRAKHGVHGSMTDGITGIPQTTLPRYVAVTYDASETKIQFWESADNSDWFQFGADVIRSLSFPVYAYVFGTSHDVTVSTTAVITNCVKSNTITISEATPPSPPTRNVGYIMDGSRANMNTAGESDHGMRINNNTRANLSSTENETANDPHGGVSSDCDSRLTAAGYVSPANANGPGDTVNPRLKTYFLETRLSWKKDYCEVNNSTAGNTPKDKPRSWLYPFRNLPEGEPGTMPVRYDKIFWCGISIYLPSNWEHETIGTSYNTSRWSLMPMATKSASTDFFGISPYSHTSGKTEWGVKWGFNPDAVTGGNTTVTNLGDVEDDSDLGKWTDWVIRMRVNPFTTTTDASTITNGMNATYNGNRGICEIWKTFGPDNYDGNGNRQFKKVFSRVNQPFGNVPHIDAAIRWTPRVYRGNWNPSGSRDPRARSGVWGGTGADDSYMFIGHDCIYVGDEELLGTGFADVNPGQLSEPA